MAKKPRHLRNRVAVASNPSVSVATSTTGDTQAGMMPATQTAVVNGMPPANDPSTAESNDLSTAGSNDLPAEEVPEISADLEPPQNRADVSPERLKWVILKLLAMPDLVRGELFHLLASRSLTEIIYGFGCRTVPYITSLLQEVGVLRRYKKRWYIMDAAFLDEVLNPDWVARCDLKIQRYYDLTRKLSDLEKRHAQALAKPDQDDDSLLEQVAGLAEDVERLQAEVEKKSGLIKRLEPLQATVDEQAAKIAELQHRLAERQKPSKADIAQYLADLRANLKHA